MEQSKPNIPDSILLEAFHEDFNFHEPKISIRNMLSEIGITKSPVVALISGDLVTLSLNVRVFFGELPENVSSRLHPGMKIIEMVA